MTEPVLVRCSFCFKHEEEVERIYAGSAANICAECVDFISGLLGDYREQKQERAAPQSGAHEDEG